MLPDEDYYSYDRITGSEQAWDAMSWLVVLIIVFSLGIMLGIYDEQKKKQIIIDNYKICNEKLTLECFQKQHTIENMEVQRIVEENATRLPWCKTYEKAPSTEQIRKDIQERSAGRK